MNVHIIKLLSIDSRRSAGAVIQALADVKSDAIFSSLFAAARRGVLQQYLKPTHRAIGSINSPMQCMMKEICAQCLQPHVDPQTGKTTYVFSCFNQDQPLDQVDSGRSPRGWRRTEFRKSSPRSGSAAA